MSILIKGMEMPEKCDYCPFYDDSVYGDCTIMHKMVDYATKPDDCPLIGIPPHGDLIDRAALVRKFKEIEESIGYAEVPLALAVAGAINDIKKAPTVIEEEEGRI